MSILCENFNFFNFRQVSFVKYSKKNLLGDFKWKSQKLPLLTPSLEKSFLVILSIELHYQKNSLDAPRFPIFGWRYAALRRKTPLNIIRIIHQNCKKCHVFFSGTVLEKPIRENLFSNFNFNVIILKSQY